MQKKLKKIECSSSLHMLVHPTIEMLRQIVKDEHLHYKNGLLLKTIESARKLRASALLISNDVPIGVCVLDHSYLIQVFIQPKYRRKGWGSMLANSVIDTLRSNRHRLWALEGYSPKASRTFWNTLHVAVKEHMGLEMSEKEWEMLSNGQTSVASLTLRRALEYHRSEGWVSDHQFKQSILALTHRDEQRWRKNQKNNAKTRRN